MGSGSSITSPEEEGRTIFTLRDGFRSKEDVQTYIAHCMTLLKRQSSCNNNVIRILKNCWNNSFPRQKYRHEIAALLAQHGFLDHVMKLNNATNGIQQNRYSFMNNLLHALWNLSNISIPLCKAACESGVIRYCLDILSKESIFEDSRSEGALRMKKAAISVLYNISRMYPESKPAFHQENAFKVLSPYLEDNNGMMRTCAILAIAYIMTEAEAAKLKDYDSISYIICRIKDALNDMSHDGVDWSVLELVQGLARIAGNDLNKKKIVNKGALKYLVHIMTNRGAEEQAQAIKVIWMLCFDDYSKAKVNVEPGCVTMLEKHAKSDNAAIKQKANGALWTLREKEMHTPKQQQKSDDKHVFLSYNHGHKVMVHKIKDRLKGEGYKVWIDTDQMGGSTLDAMSYAVENSAVVLVCMSDLYKLSPNCRAEADYTFQLKRPVVPLMMQRGYKPEGWLGMLIGSKFWIDFNDKIAYEQAYIMLKKELANHLACDEPDGAPIVVAAGAPVLKSVPPSIPSKSPPPLQVEMPLKQKFKALDWTRQEVKDWVNRSQLCNAVSDKLKQLLNEMDGPMLVEFAIFKFKAFEFFCAQLKEDYGMNLFQLLRLSQELDNLP